jgi:energy-coupling factor transporter ATP-binding protein EcfA2
MHTAIALQDVEAGYRGHVVLHDLTLKIDEGECVAITGNNGSGKSTLIKTLIGTLPLMNGTVSILGSTWRQVRSQRAPNRATTLATYPSVSPQPEESNQLFRKWWPPGYWDPVTCDCLPTGVNVSKKRCNKWGCSIDSANRFKTFPGGNSNACSCAGPGSQPIPTPP